MSLRRRRSHYRKVVFKWGLGILPNKRLCQKSRQGILSKIARCVPPCPACHVCYQNAKPYMVTLFGIINLDYYFCKVTAKFCFLTITFSSIFSFNSPTCGMIPINFLCQINHSTLISLSETNSSKKSFNELTTSFLEPQSLNLSYSISIPPST